MSDKSLGYIMMLDTSGSMQRGFPMVKIDSKAFVRCSRPNDQFGLNMFNTTASWVYPSGSNPRIITVDSAYEETRKAANAIEQIQCSEYCTNIGDAINLANQMITSASTDLKAFVLFSDGGHNEGVNPVTVLNDTSPIFIAGLGYLEMDYFNRMKAKNPKSRFYNQPNAYEVMLMFNDILADSSDSLLMLNKLEKVEKGASSVLEKFRVSSISNSAQINVVWTDPNYVYTPDSPRKVGDFQIVLIDPNNKTTTIRPDIVEMGYCIFNINNAVAGEWKALVQYVSDKELNMTVGGVDYHSTTKTKINADDFVSVGGDVKIGVTVQDNENEVQILSVKSVLTKPKISIETALAQNTDLLNMLESEANVDSDTAKLNILRNRMLANGERDILPPVRSVENLYDSNDGSFGGTLGIADIPGIYNVKLEIEGVYPKTGEKFTSIKTHSIAVS